MMNGLGYLFLQRYLQPPEPDSGSRYATATQSRLSFGLCLWGVSGSAKSHVINHLFKPFSEMDNRRFETYQKELDLFDAADSKGKRPRFFHSVLKNFTLEALAESSAINPKGSIVLSDEILAFTKNMNAYNKGSDEQYYLSMFNGHGISLSRKTPGSDPHQAKLYQYHWHNSATEAERSTRSITV